MVLNAIEATVVEEKSKVSSSSWGEDGWQRESKAMEYDLTHPLDHDDKKELTHIFIYHLPSLRGARRTP